MTDATRVTEEFPGEGKGILEILRNPWDKEKAMLLVEGWDEVGIRKAYEILKTPKKVSIDEIRKAYEILNAPASIMITSLRGVVHYNKSKMDSWSDARDVSFITCENKKYRVNHNLIPLRIAGENEYILYVPWYFKGDPPLGPTNFLPELNGTIEIVNAGITKDIIVSADRIIQISDLRCIGGEMNDK